ncbi:hypothetical protein Taro_055204 [Colocasia esculenta]|uniref:DUF1677 family protein n=1 Tax=Colocasia esculenta TaxID=4460 RepID=A0A843XS86_COLES|nr:hypothetical protein [Colocasia esculenta]
MSASVISDAVPISAPPAVEAQSAQAQGVEATAVVEVESVTCDCCGLTEECTPAYIGRVRERYAGRWVCGLCAEAVKDEICRSSPRLIGTEEALSRHMAFCRSFRSSPAPAPADANEHLIAAMRQLLRRSLDSPRAARSTPSTPRRKLTADVDAPRPALSRSGSCFPTLAG